MATTTADSFESNLVTSAPDLTDFALRAHPILLVLFGLCGHFDMDHGVAST